ncbi:uncharacterized protein IAS62_004302 [Cryptococcus decagattii]|uniref:Uncharacterized protein n=1 Tax=Cryptococcus decagattii TaxID=1859122 RepID=A0ABZ2AWM9_9TREE
MAYPSPRLVIPLGNQNGCDAAGIPTPVSQSPPLHQAMSCPPCANEVGMGHCSLFVALKRLSTFRWAEVSLALSAPTVVKDSKRISMVDRWHGFCTVCIPLEGCLWRRSHGHAGPGLALGRIVRSRAVISNTI